MNENTARALNLPNATWAGTPEDGYSVPKTSVRRSSLDFHLPSHPRPCSSHRRQAYASRLAKIFEFFAVGGSATVSWLGASPETPASAISLPLDKTKHKADDTDTSGSSSDSWSSSEDGDDATVADGDGARPLSEALPQRYGACSLSRKRRPRPPAVKGKERRLSAREFVGMLYSLGVRRAAGGAASLASGTRYVLSGHPKTKSSDSLLSRSSRLVSEVLFCTQGVCRNRSDICTCCPLVDVTQRAGLGTQRGSRYCCEAFMLMESLLLLPPDEKTNRSCGHVSQPGYHPPPRPAPPFLRLFKIEGPGFTPHPPRGLQNLCNSNGLRGDHSKGGRACRENKAIAARPRFRSDPGRRRGVAGYRERLHGTRGVRASGVPLWGPQDVGRNVPDFSGVFLLQGNPGGSLVWYTSCCGTPSQSSKQVLACVNKTVVSLPKTVSWRCRFIYCSWLVEEPLIFRELIDSSEPHSFPLLFDPRYSYIYN